MADFHRVFIDPNSFIRGAARLMTANMTIGFPTTIANLVNLSTYDAAAGWVDLGATKTGVTVSVNSAEDVFEVDQVYGDLDALPNNWECAVQTALSEVTLDRLSIAWEGSAVTLNAGPQEKEMGFGLPTTYTKRRLAVLHQKSNQKLRAYCFRQVVRAAVESTNAFMKAGEQQTVPVRFRGFADTSVVDTQKRFFVIYDQQ